MCRPGEWGSSNAGPDRRESDEKQGRASALSIRTISEKWKDRSALRLSNDSIEAVVLRGGGHIAELRLAPSAGPAINCLWAAPWPTADPGQAEQALAEAYGGGATGPFLAGYTGHALCLDIFGPPSPLEASMGVPLHGEAGARTWNFELTSSGCVCRVSLPVARLTLQREISLAAKSAVICIEERVENRNDKEREIHWVQHVSLGPPLLLGSQSSIHASLDRATTWPDGYEGHELLPDNTAFDWPMAPMLDGDFLNLETPFWRRGFGFVGAARVKVDRETGWIAAMNWELGITLVYCFRREEFPWVAVWEENSARTAEPWNSAAQVRGMEFGTTPMPLGREGIRRLGSLFGTPGSIVVEAGGVRSARYLACIARVPESWRKITDVVPSQRGLRIVGPGGEAVSIAADGVGDFLKGTAKA